LKPQPGNSDYNEIFEKFIYNSNSRALENTLQSIKEKTQQEPGVVLSDGRVIDGNRRFTALRMYQNQDYIPKTFEAVILSLDVNSENDEKKIKELELDLQLGREERVNYDPIDRIFDVYNTIEVEKLMTVEEYKKASGAGNTKGIKRDIRLAKLILQFIEIVSPGGNPVDKFYLARE
ncbi:ParB/RepB/Spo0J family partition protein, partial [Listeria monocytogenes]|nr:ParB/RepB/Spo0J family partition protein [Listeria monocytogenes]